MDKVLARMKHKQREGMSAVAWMFITLLVLVFLYIPTDLAMQAFLGQEFNSVLDNAVTAAITQVDESEISTGEINVDPIRAERAVYEVIAKSYKLKFIEKYEGERLIFEFDEDSLDDSRLKELPIVEFQHIPFTRQEALSGQYKVSDYFENGYQFSNIEGETVAIRVRISYPRQILNFTREINFDRASSARVKMAERGGN